MMEASISQRNTERGDNVRKFLVLWVVGGQKFGCLRKGESAEHVAKMFERFVQVIEIT